MKPEYDMTGTETEQAEQFASFIQDRGESAANALKRIVRAVMATYDAPAFVATVSGGNSVPTEFFETHKEDASAA